MNKHHPPASPVPRSSNRCFARAPMEKLRRYQPGTKTKAVLGPIRIRFGTFGQFIQNRSKIDPKVIRNQSKLDPIFIGCSTKVSQYQKKHPKNMPSCPHNVPTLAVLCTHERTIGSVRMQPDDQITFQSRESRELCHALHSKGKNMFEIQLKR